MRSEICNVESVTQDAMDALQEKCGHCGCAIDTDYDACAATQCTSETCKASVCGCCSASLEHLDYMERSQHVLDCLTKHGISDMNNTYANKCQVLHKRMQFSLWRSLHCILGHLQILGEEGAQRVFENVVEQYLRNRDTDTDAEYQEFMDKYSHMGSMQNGRKSREWLAINIIGVQLLGDTWDRVVESEIISSEDMEYINKQRMEYYARKLNDDDGENAQVATENWKYLRFEDRKTVLGVDAMLKVLQDNARALTQPCCLRRVDV